MFNQALFTILCTCTFLFKKHPHTWHKYIWTLQGKKYFHSYFHYGIQFFVIYEFIPSRFCSSDWNKILIFFQQVYLSECKNLNAYWKEITTGISKFKFRRNCDGFAKCFKYFILKYEIVLFKSRSYKVNISSVKILLTL